MPKHKFRECRDCAHQGSAKCVRCGAGEFFEEKEVEPSDDEIMGMWDFIDE